MSNAISGIPLHTTSLPLEVAKTKKENLKWTHTEKCLLQYIVNNIVELNGSVKKWDFCETIFTFAVKELPEHFSLRKAEACRSIISDKTDRNKKNKNILTRTFSKKDQEIVEKCINLYKKTILGKVESTESSEVQEPLKQRKGQWTDFEDCLLIVFVEKTQTSEGYISWDQCDRFFEFVTKKISLDINEERIVKRKTWSTYKDKYNKKKPVPNRDSDDFILANKFFETFLEEKPIKTSRAYWNSITNLNNMHIFLIRAFLNNKLLDCPRESWNVQDRSIWEDIKDMLVEASIEFPDKKIVVPNDPEDLMNNKKILEIYSDYEEGEESGESIVCGPDFQSTFKDTIEGKMIAFLYDYQKLENHAK